MSILIIIYILNYVDRTNIASARMRGFEADLDLHGTQFATVLSILYVGYFFMQVPSNMLLNHIGKPSLYLPAVMMVWGAISILTGIVNNFIGALLTRFLMGFVEAPFVPGALFSMSKWYKRNELGTRIALLYCGLTLGNAVGPLIASGILDGMDGRLGCAGWRWLIYIEGAVTIVVALFAMFILPDFPATTGCLREEERRLAMRRIEEDVGVGDEDEPEGGSFAGLRVAVLDWKVWWMVMITMSHNVSQSFTAYFPTLTATMGFDPTATLLLCAPPFLFASIMQYTISRHSDRIGERFYHLTIPIFGGVVGFIISICTMNTAARYVSLNTFPRPPSKRAVALALTNACVRIAFIAGSYIWPSRWGPTYRNSYAICTVCSMCCIVMAYIFKLHLAHLNRELVKEERQKGIRKGFRYML